jgi:Fe-S cluster biogenesis protein NfuA
MFIQTEATPNPATLKFLPGRSVMGEDRVLDMTTPADAAISPLAGALFSVEHVSGVFFGPDFISVTKAAGEWQHLKPAILGAIMEHFTSGAPMLDKAVQATAEEKEFFDPSQSEIVDSIKELIETRVLPSVAGDGGDISFRGFRDGTVFLSMRGACSGCPSSTATLKNGIENLFRHYIPEVVSVEQI